MVGTGIEWTPLRPLSALASILDSSFCFVPLFSVLPSSEYEVSLSLRKRSLFSLSEESLASSLVVEFVFCVLSDASALPSSIVEVLRRRERRDDCHRFFRGSRRRDVGVMVPVTPLPPGGVPTADKSCTCTTKQTTINEEQIY